MMFRTSGSVGALIMIGGKARAMRAKGDIKPHLPSLRDSWEKGVLNWAWKGKENLLMMRRAACDIPIVKGERFLLE